MQSEFVDRIIAKYAQSSEQEEIIRTHSQMVAQKALRIAKDKGLESRLDLQFLEDAAMLHDIGIVGVNAPSIHCYGNQPYIRHGIIGAEILAKEGVGERYQRVCRRHTGTGLTAEEIKEAALPLPPEDLLPETLEEKLICYADKFYSKSRDLRYEKSSEEIHRSMKKFGKGAYERFLRLESEFG